LKHHFEIEDLTSTHTDMRGRAAKVYCVRVVLGAKICDALHDEITRSQLRQ